MDLCPATFRSFVVQRFAKIAGHQPQLKPPYIYIYNKVCYKEMK